MYDGVRDFLQNVHYHAPTGEHKTKLLIYSAGPRY